MEQLDYMEHKLEELLNILMTSCRYVLPTVTRVYKSLVDYFSFLSSWFAASKDLESSYFEHFMSFISKDSGFKGL